MQGIFPKTRVTLDVEACNYLLGRNCSGTGDAIGLRNRWVRCYLVGVYAPLIELLVCAELPQLGIHLLGRHRRPFSKRHSMIFIIVSEMDISIS